MNESTHLLRIGELADQTGKTVRSLHFYEELGLLAPSSRTKGGFRLYDSDQALRVQWIDRMQELGFSLAEIRDFLTAQRQEAHGPAAMAQLQAFYMRKLHETRTAIARLQALETDLQDSLRYLHTCHVCEPATLKSACHSCDENLHPGEQPPPMVAAVQDDTRSAS